MDLDEIRVLCKCRAIRARKHNRRYRRLDAMLRSITSNYSKCVRNLPVMTRSMGNRTRLEAILHFGDLRENTRQRFMVRESRSAFDQACRLCAYAKKVVSNTTFTRYTIWSENRSVIICKQATQHGAVKVVRYSLDASSPTRTAGPAPSLRQLHAYLATLKRKYTLLSIKNEHICIRDSANAFDNYPTHCRIRNSKPSAISRFEHFPSNSTTAHPPYGAAIAKRQSTKSQELTEITC